MIFGTLCRYNHRVLHYNTWMIVQSTTYCKEDLDLVCFSMKISTKISTKEPISKLSKIYTLWKRRSDVRETTETIGPRKKPQYDVAMLIKVATPGRRCYRSKAVLLSKSTWKPGRIRRRSHAPIPRAFRFRSFSLPSFSAHDDATRSSVGIHDRFLRDIHQTRGFSYGTVYGKFSGKILCSPRIDSLELSRSSKKPKKQNSLQAMQRLTFK